MDNLENDFNFLLNHFGKEIKINNITTKAIISNTKDKNIDFKTIRTLQKFRQGDIINYQNKQWLIFGEVKQNNNIYVSYIRKCQEIIFNKQTIYSLVDSRIFDVEENQYFNLVDNQILITIPKNKININDIITFNEKGYKVVAINDVKENILVLRCQYSATDTHIYTIEVTSSIEVEEGKMYQLTCVAKDNDIIVESPELTYVVLDNSICTISNEGLITTIKSGITSITVTYQNVSEIVTINVSEKEILEQYFIKSSSGDVDYINLGSAGRTFKVIDSNGDDIMDKTFTFTLEQSDKNPTITPTQIIKDTEIKDYSNIKLIPNTNNVKGYFYLVGKCGDLEARKELRVKATMDG